MKKPALVFLILVFSFGKYGMGQQAITLEQCQLLAEQNHPLANQFELIDEVNELKLKNIKKNYLPDMALNGSMHYQSDVTKVPAVIPVPELEIQPIDKDWYKISLDVQQAIYDGGVTKKQKLVEEADRQIQIQQNHVQLYQIREQVNKVFFNILTLQENLNILHLHSEVLDARISEVETAVRSGVLLDSDLSELLAERIVIDQRKAEIMIAKETSKEILSELISVEIPPDASFEMPAVTIEDYSPGRKRPEYLLMDMEQQKLDALKKSAVTKEIPRFYGYGQVGYGRPALDMLNNNFEDFYLIGLKMNWNIYDWGNTRNQKKILDLNKSMIENRKNDLDRAIRIKADEESSEIRKYQMLIEKDKEILQLRESLTKTYESQLKNGIITSAEYITHLNAESEARLNLVLHEIQLAEAGMSYLVTVGER
jgi:outer membrane protein TolC